MEIRRLRFIEKLIFSGGKKLEIIKVSVTIVEDDLYIVANRWLPFNWSSEFS